MYYTFKYIASKGTFVYPMVKESLYSQLGHFSMYVKSKKNFLKLKSWP